MLEQKSKKKKKTPSKFGGDGEDGSGLRSSVATFLRTAGKAWWGEGEGCEGGGVGGGQAVGGLQLEQAGVILSSGDSLQSRNGSPSGLFGLSSPAGRPLCSPVSSLRRGG